MIPPGQVRPNKPFFGGVIQIWVTRACDKQCFGCTQGSNLRGGFTRDSKYPAFMSVEHFEQAVLSLRGYFGVVGVFGGNPALHPEFPTLCEILRKWIPFEQRGLWCNHPFGHGKVMRETFNPRVSNLNVHLDKTAYETFKRDWPESQPFGLTDDSRHSPPFVAMKDVVVDEGERWQLISDCDINKHWSAMIGVFRSQLRAWFCEIAGAQAMLHQDERDYPDTGKEVVKYVSRQKEIGEGEFESYSTDYNPLNMKLYNWWELPMTAFKYQVRKHCHECGVPLKGYGNLAQADTGVEQVSKTHESIYKPRSRTRQVEVVTELVQLNTGRINKFTDYVGNAKR